jgi:hypothetical protein
MTDLGERYLFCFGYSWPDAIERSARHADADLDEESAMVFVDARTEAEALEIGAAFAEEFVRRLFGPTAYSWRQLAFAHWVESDPSIIRRAEDCTPVIGAAESIAAVAERMANSCRLA